MQFIPCVYWQLIPFCFWVIFHCLDVPQFLYPGGGFCLWVVFHCMTFPMCIDSSFLFVSEWHFIVWMCHSFCIPVVAFVSEWYFIVWTFPMCIDNSFHFCLWVAYQCMDVLRFLYPGDGFCLWVVLHCMDIRVFTAYSSLFLSGIYATVSVSWRWFLSLSGMSLCGCATGSASWRWFCLWVVLQCLDIPVCTDSSLLSLSERYLTVWTLPVCTDLHSCLSLSFICATGSASWQRTVGLFPVWPLPVKLVETLVYQSLFGCML